MANYSADAIYSEHKTATEAADGLETLLETVATTVIIRAVDIIKVRDEAYIAYVVTSDATA